MKTFRATPRAFRVPPAPPKIRPAPILRLAPGVSVRHRDGDRVAQFPPAAFLYSDAPGIPGFRRQVAAHYVGSWT
jgi:hypothetical protein